jgi:hypothetical protein
VTSAVICASRLDQIADCVGVVSAPPFTVEELTEIDALVGGA